MKKIYILSMALLAAGSIVAAPSAPSFLTKAKKNGKTELKKSFKKGPAFRAGDATPVWRPATQFVSEWNPDSEEWEEISKYLTTYDKAGRILTDEETSLYEESASFTTYVYDDNGMPLTKLVQGKSGGAEYVNYSYTVREYDPIVKSCIISNTESIWFDDAWSEAGNCYRRDITRNGEGNVTEVVIRTLYDGNYEASQKMTVEYGPDNKANRIVTYVLSMDDQGEFVWLPEIEYKDIVWHHTNGQIISEDETTSVDNGIASCTVLDSDGENIVTVEYPDDKGSFKSHLVYANGELDVNMTVIDSYGSYDYSQTEIYREEGEEDYTYTSVERYRKNEYGLETELYAAEAEMDEPLFVTAWAKGEIESNAEYGYPELFTVTEYDPEEEVFVNAMRVKFEDYLDVAGVGSVASEDPSAPVEFFTLQGIKVSGDLTPGLYIRRQGNKVMKIVR